MSDVLDLDALAPPTATVRFQEKDITVQPPKTSDLLRLGALGQKLQTADEATDEELDAAIADLTNLIQKMIPELSGVELHTQQLLGLVGLISKMATPPEQKELDKAGITSNGSTDPKA
jgi:hypothetical protein